MRRGKKNKIIFLAPFQKDLFSAGQETGQCGLVPHLYCSQILWRTLRSSNQSEEHFSVASCLRWGAVVKEESCFQVRVHILSTQIWMRSTKLSFTQIPLPFKTSKRPQLAVCGDLSLPARVEPVLKAPVNLVSSKNSNWDTSCSWIRNI